LQVSAVDRSMRTETQPRTARNIDIRDFDVASREAIENQGQQVNRDGYIDRILPSIWGIGSSPHTGSDLIKLCIEGAGIFLYFGYRWNGRQVSSKDTHFGG
jgi:hypothetical protein